MYRAAGRLRVLHAYAVDEKGQRSEASSERNRQIFFRGMQPGSTMVMQYRLDTPPKGYLARYYNETWSFQGVGDPSGAAAEGGAKTEKSEKKK